MKYASLLLLSLVSVNAAAHHGSECTQGKHKRQITVVKAEKGCEVQYTKDGAAAQTLWTYHHQTEECAAKAEGFAQKLSGLGWTCAALAEPATAAPAATPAAPAAPAKK